MRRGAAAALMLASQGRPATSSASSAARKGNDNDGYHPVSWERGPGGVLLERVAPRQRRRRCPGPAVGARRGQNNLRPIGTGRLGELLGSGSGQLGRPDVDEHPPARELPGLGHQGVVTVVVVHPEVAVPSAASIRM